MLNPIEFHKRSKGKIELNSKVPLKTMEDLSNAYTPGVAKISELIYHDKSKVYELTSIWNTVAVVTDGSAVLGLGDIGPQAAMPVMEGKAILFKKFGNVDAFPICLDTKDPNKIIETVKLIAPSFGGINLEDISAPRCFEIEEKLIEALDIPVFHDDQHGTAIVVLSGLINALKIVKKNIDEIKVVVNGAGAAGIAVSNILLESNVKNLILVDSKGIVTKKRENLNKYKKKIAEKAKIEISGTLKDAIKNADVFIGVSKPNLISKEMILTMAKEPIIFAMANPNPEIMPKDAYDAGAAVVATGRSDFPNQINNVLVFPGIFRGALDAKVKKITMKIKINAAKRLAELIKNPTKEKIIPSPFDKDISETVAKAVRRCI